MLEIPSGFDCDYCGDQWTILTDSPQECCCLETLEACICEEMDYQWWASVDDDVVCLGCGAIGQLDADHDGAHITSDDSSEHNIAVWDRLNSEE